ncbi:MAG: AAA family ATPase [Angustibacter sp.]
MSELAVSGYKAVRERQSISLAPLTLIAGANSSGKSSFMQPFLMMKQTLDSAFDPGPMLLHGPNVKVTDHTQIFSRGKAKNDVVTQFSVAMARGEDSREVTFSSSGSGNLQIVRDTSWFGDQKVELSEPLTNKQRNHLLKMAGSRFDSLKKILNQRQSTIDLVPTVARNRCFLEPAIRAQEQGTVFVWDVVPFFDDSWAVDFLRGIIHVPGLRGNPERSYQRSATGDTYPGTFETYVASIMLNWMESDSPRTQALAADLERLGLTWKVLARRLNDASIELMVGRMPHAQQGGAHDLVNVADVGFGVSQTLPVLVALHAARSGQVVYVEQPEIHLHPKAQLALAASLVNAAKRGVVVVAETHSSLLIRGVQIALARREISPDSVSLNWFSRDPFSGAQSIAVAQLDNSGRFGDWPVDFDEVMRDADWEYIDAVED